MTAGAERRPGDVEGPPILDPFPRRRVTSPAMRHSWTDVVFVSWPYHPAHVQRLLPPGLEADTWNGAAWVSHVWFVLQVQIPAPAPRIPWLGSLVEANVRTYVRGPDGRTGIWFLSLDASRLGLALFTRAWYRIPYAWARMRLRRAGPLLVYECRRRWPRADARGLVAVVPERALDTGSLEELDCFLTARFDLWSPGRRGFAHTLVEHPPWPLWRGRAVHIEETLLRSVGLPEPTTTPVVHVSPGVAVLVGARREVASPPSAATAAPAPAPGRARSGRSPACPRRLWLGSRP